MTTYPENAGYKTEVPETSMAAAQDIDAESIREQVRRILARWNCTADQAAEFLGLSILSVRPRFSELRALGEVEDTGERKLNASGHKAVVWRLVPKPSQQELQW